MHTLPHASQLHNRSTFPHPLFVPTLKYRNKKAVEAKMNETHTKNPSSQIVIFDTTLRDGEQSPGATMSLQEK